MALVQVGEVTRLACKVHLRLPLPAFDLHV